MSGTKRIPFSIVIHAPVAIVWRTMLEPESFKRWTSAFAEGSHYDGSWEKGERIRFVAPSGDGMVAEIADNRKHEFISIRHVGMVLDGVVDTESASIRAWAPAFENYTFTAIAEGTKLAIELDVAPDWEAFMHDAWPRALELLKQLCEERQANQRG